MDLAAVLAGAAGDHPPPPDGTVTVCAPPDTRSAGVFAFTGYHVISAAVDSAWVRAALPAGDLAAPLSPSFLQALAIVTGLATSNLDTVFAAPWFPGGPDLGLRAADDCAHERVVRARAYRAEVRAWVVPAGVLTLGRGVAGRWEVSVEVAEAARGRGLGRALFTAARCLVPAGEPVWAQVAPGNVASIRAVLAAGFRPVGAEVLLVSPAGSR